MSTARKSDSLTKLALTAMFCAILLVMTFIPYVGYISYGLLSITTLHIVVILGAILLGPMRGTILGAFWGVTCLLYALYNGTADAAIFINPLISVLPRILVGFLTAWYFVGLYKLTRRLMPKKEITAFTVAAAITAVLGTLTNTALVLSAISLFGTGVVTLGSTLTNILKVALSLNGVIEAVSALVLVPAIAVPLHRFMLRRGA